MIRIIKDSLSKREEIFCAKEERVDVSATVAEIIAKVRAEGDAALRYYSEKFDKAVLTSLRVSEEEIEAEYKRISEAYNVPVEQVKNMVAADDLKADLVVGAAMKLVRENAKVGAPKAKRTTTKKAAAPAAEGEAAPKETAKKAPAKKTTTAKKTTAKAAKEEKAE